MSMTDTATRLIKRFGQSATITRIAPDQRLTEPTVEYPNASSFSPVIVPGGEIVHHCTVAVTEYTIEQRASGGIADSDLRVFMTAGVEPTTADSIEIGGKSYNVQRVGTLGPDGTVICYELQVRA